ncbi:hypothetical protein GN958_ATG19103 [Phytophthora infestans]|uniref:Uncharacterized protein n=1 Tax=Phytophthora infestans TaxID=4787 RepID=A0A8S9TT60_PHYIN|nr:hypothetical protein GN958_ATG19103 [Phytophthora infestans]
MTTSKTANEIRGVMDALKLEVIASYFDQDDDEIEGVSVTAFNTYVGDGEGLRIPLRFLALNDERIVIVELPTTVHESTAASFEKMFNRASGNDLEVASCRSMTARRAGNPNKEADTSFGPKRTTLNRAPAPALRTVTDWVTLAVEVGRSQSWASLKGAARWWCGYTGIQYVLLLKISAPGTQIRYALYDSTTRPHPTIRPTASGTFRHAAAGAAVNVTFDMRRILSIPPNAALPPAVSPTARVDLRIVMDLVIDSL